MTGGLSVISLQINVLISRSLERMKSALARQSGKGTLEESIDLFLALMILIWLTYKPSRKSQKFSNSALMSLRNSLRLPVLSVMSSETYLLQGKSILSFWNPLKVINIKKIARSIKSTRSDIKRKRRNESKWFRPYNRKIEIVGIWPYGLITIPRFTNQFRSISTTYSQN